MGFHSSQCRVTMDQFPCVPAVSGPASCKWYAGILLLSDVGAVAYQSTLGKIKQQEVMPCNHLKKPVTFKIKQTVSKTVRTQLDCITNWHIERGYTSSLLVWMDVNEERLIDGVGSAGTLPFIGLARFQHVLPYPVQLSNTAAISWFQNKMPLLRSFPSMTLIIAFFRWSDNMMMWRDIRQSWSLFILRTIVSWYCLYDRQFIRYWIDSYHAESHRFMLYFNILCCILLDGTVLYCIVSSLMQRIVLHHEIL